MKAISKTTAQKELNKLKSKEAMLLEIINRKDDSFSKIKTFADACKATKENPKNKKFTVGSKDTIAYEKLKVIARALNGEDNWADYSDSNQQKYYPYFVFDKKLSRFVFDLSGCLFDDTDTCCGVRQVFKTEELAKYAAIQFAEIYNSFLL